jgi:IclR family transcriptional regulator, acetate operon repressor
MRTAYYYKNDSGRNGWDTMVKARAGNGAARKVTGPRSLMRLLGLFDALAKAKEGLTLADLNTELSSPKSSLLNLLRPLVASGYLNYDSSRYRLGPSIFRLAGNIMSVWNFSNAVRPYLEELAQRSQESVCLGVLDRAGKVITYVDAVESPHPVRFSVPIGAVRPLYSTAAGRVLLAFASEQWQEEYFRTTKLEQRTPRTITTRKGLREELDRIRKTHVSVSIGENFPESAAISAPIFGADGTLVAAIAIGAPSDRLAPRLAELRPMIVEVASRASGVAPNAADLDKSVYPESEPEAGRPVSAPRRRAALT